MSYHSENYRVDIAPSLSVSRDSELPCWVDGDDRSRCKYRENANGKQDLDEGET